MTDFVQIRTTAHQLAVNADSDQVRELAVLVEALTDFCEEAHRRAKRADRTVQDWECGGLGGLLR